LPALVTFTDSSRYTLAVGKAPFHASKREDIYKKLQQREYKWPEVSKNQNDISTDLKDLVSSLLVHEDDRPGPDEIVSHCFFKTKFIPDHLDSNCTSRKPHWPNIRPPNAQTLQRGFSESWAKLCKESGVGLYAPGKTFPLDGAKRIASVVKDCEKEIAAGRAPIVPIPQGTVYLPFPERVNVVGKRINSLSEIAEERESSAEGPQLAEISANDRATKTVSKVPKPQSRRLKENAEPVEPMAQELQDPAPSVKRKNSSRKKPEERKASSSRQASGERSYKQRAIPTQQASQEQPVDSKPMLSRQPSRRERPAPAITRPTTTARSRQASVVKQLTLPRTNSAPVLDAPRRVRTLRAVSASEEPVPKQKTPEVVVIPDDEEPSIEIMDTTPSFTDPTAVLAQAAKLRDNIASALTGGGSGRGRSDTSQTLPFVSKWVDYAKKHGVGYVMEDGSIGCLFNATSRHPVTHAVVRHGYGHLQKAGKDLEAVGQVPLEYYTHRAGDELRRAEVEGDRKRTTGILWAKFGRYMCQALAGQEIQKALAGGSCSGQTIFVRYYQRLGTVGIWGFSNGCFQVCGSQPPGIRTNTD
jgi:myosin-1